MLIIYGSVIIVISFLATSFADYDDWGSKIFGMILSLVGGISIVIGINSLKKEEKEDISKVMIDNRIEFIQDTLITTKKGDTIKYNKNIEFFNKENKKYD